MNLILLEPSDYIGAAHVRLQGRRSTHIRTVLNATLGQHLCVGDLGGRMGQGEIIALSDNAVELTVALEASPPPKLPLTILLALPRPKMLRRVLRTVAELGVSELILLNTSKVEKSYWQSPALDPATVRAYFIDGLEQSRDTVLPAFRCERLFKPFVEDHLSALTVGTTALVAHPGAGVPCPIALDRACTLAIGPEGGFSDYEVAKLQAAEFTSVQLGTRILRVENALTTLVARLFS